MTAYALTLDSAKSVAFIEQHGECDLPTRRHAEESRPAPMQGRTMSPILAPSAEELMQPGFVSGQQCRGRNASQSTNGVRNPAWRPDGYPCHVKSQTIGGIGSE